MGSAGFPNSFECLSTGFYAFSASLWSNLMPGPIPKRSEHRRYRGKHAGPDLVKAPAGQPDVEDDLWPDAPETWHPIATMWYDSLAVSGQSAFYEASDVALAYYVAELMSKALQAAKPSGQIIASIDSMMDKLLTSEGARRRARVELQRGEPEPDEGIADQLEKYRRAASQ